MQTLNLLTEEIGSIDDAQHLINDFHWFLTVDEMAGQWTVKAGETTVFTSDSKDTVEAFLYGMALAYKGLPPQLYAKLFSMMAGIDVPTTLEESPVDLDLSEEPDDDERLSDLAFDKLDTPSSSPDEPFSFDK